MGTAHRAESQEKRLFRYNISLIHAPNVVPWRQTARRACLVPVPKDGSGSSGYWRQRASFSSRCFWRDQSRLAWDSRLSWFFLPLAMPIFIFAMPRWLK